MTAGTTFRKPFPLFTLAAATIAAACIAITRSHTFAAQPDVVAWAVTLDLTLTIPLVYYLFVVRSGTARPITIVPVFAIGAAIAAIALPRANQQFLHELRFLVAPLEVVTIVLLVQRVRRGATDDPFVLSVLTAEASMLWYAVAGWTRRADVPAGAQLFTVHKRTGWGSIVAAMMIVIAAESVALHLIVRMWSVRTAWVLTALDLYGIAWLLGDFNALRLRPSYVLHDALHIRYGLRSSITVSRDQIASCEPVRDEAEWKRPGVLKVAMLDAPRLLIRLREPLPARVLLGLRRTVEAIAISPDDDGEAIGALLSA